MELIWRENDHHQYGKLTIIIKNIHAKNTKQGLFEFDKYFCDMKVNGKLFKDTQITFPITDMGIGIMIMLHV